jgi:hypothetical protein
MLGYAVVEVMESRKKRQQADITITKFWHHSN